MGTQEISVSPIPAKPSATDANKTAPKESSSAPIPNSNGASFEAISSSTNEGKGKMQAGNIQTGCAECRIVIEKPTDTGSPASYLSIVISTILVIAGWIVVNKAQANRERRKQIREFATGLIEDLAELESSVISYHTNVRDRVAEQAIIAKLSRFEKSCASLPKFVSSQRTLKAVDPKRLLIEATLIREMRKAMTLKHFSDEHENPIDVHGELIQEIEVSTTNVQEALEAAKLASLD